MKRIRNVLSMLVFILIIGVSFNVKAEEFSYYITNSGNYEYNGNNETKSIKRGETITVTAVLNNKDNVTDYQISSGKLTIRWDNKHLALKEINGKHYDETISDVDGLTIGSVSEINNKITLSDIKSTGTLKDKINKLVEFKFTVLNDGDSTDTKIYQMDGEDSLKCYNIQEERTVNCGESLLSELKYSVAKSTVNTLSMIKINGMDLEFFNENNNDYDIIVDSDVEKIKIEAIKTDSKATLSGDIGEKKVSYGINKFEVYVTSESGVKNIYNLNVTREDSRSNDNTLSTLYVYGGDLDFNPLVTEYTVNVDNDYDEIGITSSLNDSKAKYVEDYSYKTVKLVEGSNKIEIRVISEKGEERVYTLNINRALSSNNSLKTLNINNEKIDLRENEFIYYHEVENSIDAVTITATPNDSRATIELDDSYQLKEGDNEITIKVKAASGQEISYIINITRKKILSKDSLLSSLKIDGYSIDFKPEEKMYDLKIKDDDDKIGITAIPEDSNASISIDGNKDLENGSIIKINVKAEDGSITRYIINIEKGSNGISPIIIILIILLLLLGGCVGLIFYRKKKKENNEFDKIDQDDANNLETNDNIVPEDSIVPKSELESNEDYVGTHEKEEEKTLETENNDEEKDV